jgi:carboxymethylenebutenolidase
MIRKLAVATFAAVVTLEVPVDAQVPSAPDTVVVQSGGLGLRALLWKPHGSGPFPAVLFNHGSYGSGAPLKPEEPAALGPVFARHGYVFLFLFRRGIGLSSNQGTADGDLMARALAEHGQEGRNRIQLELLETDKLDEAMSALAFLRALPVVDPDRVAVAGHSFGGSLTLLLVARDSALRAAVVFSGSARSWGPSPELRARLLAAVRHTAPVFFIHAANDYSTTPGEALAAEMQRLGRPHRLRIYPAVGRTTHEGHNFVYRSVATWEPDVFAFLDQRLRRREHRSPGHTRRRGRLSHASGVVPRRETVHSRHGVGRRRIAGGAVVGTRGASSRPAPGLRWSRTIGRASGRAERDRVT